MIVRAAVINSPTSVGPKGWEGCFEAADARADVFGINENHSRRQKEAFKDLSREHGLRKFGLTGPNPLFNDPKVWRRLHESQHQLHGRGPKARRWPGFNSPRFATVAVYEPVQGGGPDLTVINTHLVPRGPKVPGWWRDRARRRALKKLDRLIQAHLARGRAVLVIGDFNMDEAPDLEDVVWVVGAHRGVDKIGIAVPDGWRLAAWTGDRFPAPTDHRTGASALIEIERVR